MRRRFTVSFFAVCFTLFLFTFLSASLLRAEAAAKFHIGIITGTVSQSEDDLRGAERLIKEYGDVARGGMIKHVTYPDSFMSEMETSIAQIVGLADDPLMKVIVINQGVPGTSEAIRKIKEKNPKMLCFVGTPHEDPNVVGEVADLAIDSDFVSRGYIIPWVAKQLGCDTFVHISFPRHMSLEVLSRRYAVMQQACKDLGLKFAAETAPDPTSDVGVVGAQQYILEKTPAWVQKYGKKTAFFTTNNALTEPLIRQIAVYGGYHIEPDLSSTLMGYPGAFGIDLKKEAGNWPAILKKVEDAVIKAGAKGRMGAWVYSMGYCNSAGMAEFGKRIVEGKAKLSDRKALLDCYLKYSPGASWNGNTYVDASTKAAVKSFYVLYQDSYIFGKGYMGTTKLKIPAKYNNIQPKAQ